MNILYFLLIGIVAGWLAGTITKGSGFGLIGNLVVGAVGGLIGGWVFDYLNIAFYGIVGNLIAAVVGALILLFIINLIKK